MAMNNYIITNCSDMIIADILPGSSKKVKDLLPKHIKYHNNGMLRISTIITNKEEKKNESLLQKEEIVTIVDNDNKSGER